MMKTPTNQVRSSEEGLAGVAALIIFIAIVLVGAITAAVILDVTGSLEQQAAQTGQDASNQISSTLQILEVSGNTDSAGDSLDSLEFLVTVAPGTPELNLNDTLVTITTEGQRFDLVSEGTFQSTDPNINADAQFVVEGVVPNDPDAQVIQGPQQRFNVTINDDATGDDLGGDVLAPNTRLQVTFTTGPGGQSFQEVRIPSTLTADETIAL